MITLEEMKQYLRIDFGDDDALISGLIAGAERLCMDVARVETEEELFAMPNGKVAVLYAASYMYEHREDADYHQMALMLRSLLFAKHEGGF
ncbi:head-tail connector protein [Eubacterium sp. AB3007]|uniref:head-tail connector protein n=1 Tax=Eubacterium sp. AB3007 TaxID=1392487 RepID=UPI000485F93B